MQEEQQIAQQQLGLSKSWRLPKFELGYHYQSILGQRFNGLHVGLSLPLWEHKYRMEQQEAQVQFSDLQVLTHRNEHYHELKALYEEQRALQEMLQQYNTALSGIQSIALLDKALALGEISTAEYFLEWSLYQNAQLRQLETEWAFQQVAAKLYQYLL